MRLNRPRELYTCTYRVNGGTYVLFAEALPIYRPRRDPHTSLANLVWYTYAICATPRSAIVPAVFLDFLARSLARSLALVLAPVYLLLRENPSRWICGFVRRRSRSCLSGTQSRVMLFFFFFNAVTRPRLACASFIRAEQVSRASISLDRGLG